MSRGIKIGIVTFLGIAGLAVLLIGSIAQSYSLSMSIIVALAIWITAALVYVLVRESKSGRRIAKTITDSGCREALNRK